MTIDKQALRERYSPKPAPECHICGKEMTIQRMSASRITYGCTGATYDDKGCHYAEGRSIADDHYEQSRVTVVDVSDPDVLALLDELEAAKQDSARWFKAFEKAVSIGARYEERIEQLEKGHQEAAKQINSWRRLAKQNIAERGKDISELEAARQRIAELESKLSKPVLLPKTNGYWTEQEKAYEEAITLAKRQVRLAGFSVEDM
ncbi:ead/Ea22-like family protein [Salmonella enterica subsp. enterica serovar Oslo]|nr:ead/Ea22-like family protein [Salmonella enterica subsp. enterica serovar Oslo]